MAIANVKSIGITLHTYLYTNYSSLSDISTSSVKEYDNTHKKELMNAIVKAYKSLGVALEISVFNDEKLKKSVKYNIGDIIEYSKNGTLYYYVVTFLSDGKINTFPNADDDLLKQLNGISIPYKVIRPNFDTVTDENINNVIDSDSVQNLLETIDHEEQTFNIPKRLIPLDGEIQIGDITLTVDPTQISFNTQNGYQYFPTIRTEGNPKVPTLQQIRNISINFIFPNEDTVNYQLLPIFAMFKRTPFVNIRNKDINEFFSDLIEDNGGFLSVGLESIQIQSVQGFPNTLQAQITFLPFDYRIISTNFAAIKTYKGVKYQQSDEDIDKELEAAIEASRANLKDTSLSASRLNEIVNKFIDSSNDFRYSVPFRSYYQGLIADIKYVTDDLGNIVPIGHNGINSNADIGATVLPFRPTKASDNLHHYKAIDNVNQPVTFKYNYIDQNVREFQKDLSSQRLQAQEAKLKRLDTFRREFLINKETLITEWFSLFQGVDDELRRIEIQFNSNNNAISQLLETSGISINDDKLIHTEINGILDPFFKGLGNASGLTSIFRFLFTDEKNVGKGFSYLKGELNTTITKKDYFNLTKSAFTTYKDDPMFNTDANINMLTAFGKIWDWMKDNPTRKANFVAFMGNLANSIKSTFSNETNYINGPNGLEVINMPIKTASLVIDGRMDVINSWTASFVNKFVPMQIPGYEYPFYQHIGSEDMNVGLNVTSLPGSKLKKNLSDLSLRIYNSAKMVLLNNPQLYPYLDSRLNIEIPTHHFLSSLGLSKVVYNSSNTQTITGQPDSWTTNINFTKSNINIEDYNSIESETDDRYIENVISQLISRIRVDSLIEIDGKQYIDDNPDVSINDSVNDIIRKTYNNTQITVYKYKDPGTNTYITDIDSLLRLSFAYSPWGTLLNKHLEDQLKEANSRNKPAEYINTQYNIKAIKDSKDIMKKKLDGAFKEEVDEHATAALYKIFKRLPRLELAIRNILYQRDISQKKEYLALKNITTIQKDNLSYNPLKWFIDNKSQTQATALGIGTAAGVALVMETSITAATLGTLTLVFSVPLLTVFIAGYAVGAGMALANNTINEAKRSIVREYGDTLVNYVQSMDKLLSVSIGKQVIRDPFVAKLLLNKDIIGKDLYYKLNYASRNIKSNCYKDFDTRSTYKISDKLGSINISPDYFLFNNTISGHDRNEYLQTSLEKSISMSKMAMMLSLQEYETAIKKYDIIKDSLTDLGSGVYQGIKDELQYGKDLEETLAKVQKTYYDISLDVDNTDQSISVTKSESPLNSVTLDVPDTTIAEIKATANITTAQSPTNAASPNDSETVKANFEDIKKYIKDNKIQITEEGLASLDAFSKTRGLSGGMDQKKMSLIRSAKIITLVEILEVYSSITSFISTLQKGKEVSAPGTNVVTPSTTVDKIIADAGIDVQSKKALEGLKSEITNILKSTLGGDKSAGLTNSKFTYGVYDADKYQGNEKKKKKDENKKEDEGNKFVQFPQIKVMQNFLYNKLGSYIRLNDYLNEYEKSGIPPSLNNLPNFKFLDYWNVREVESQTKKLALQKQLAQSAKDNTNRVNQLFPTFKIYFAEEDKYLDDYYSYDAIQSIQTVDNKENASKTAIIVFSNLLGNITNRLSYHVESPDLIPAADGNPDIFFGTLDIKPGTKIIIKMGYDSDPRRLSTIFVGRVIEMSAGTTTRMVCQSHSAQLQEEVISHRYGTFSKEKMHGDIASATLDTLPSLKNMGTLNPFERKSNQFSGKNVYKANKNSFNRFLLTSLYSQVSASDLSQDNPRDENIYLPYQFIDNKYSHPTFDWVVYNQTAWEVLNELSLYHRNTFPLVRTYNDDGISKKNELRETLIIGDKSGYYKYTDGYEFSSYDFDGIKLVVEDFNKYFKKIIKLDKSNKFVTVFKTIYNKNSKITENSLEQYITDKDYQNFYLQMQDRTTAVAVISYITNNIHIDNLGIDTGYVLADLLVKAKNLISGAGAKKARLNKLLNDIQFFSTQTPFATKQNLKDINFNKAFYEKGLAFNRIVKTLLELFNDNGISFELVPEHLLNVKSVSKNTDEKLINDPRYKRIQQHHLISDTTNIINSSIVLNNTFHNSVNLYYLPEPTMVDGAGLSEKQNKKMNVWPTKAFRDMGDEHVRPLNSFQKNVDTNIYDVAKSFNNVFEEYEQLKVGKDDSDHNAVKTFLEEKGGIFNTKDPNWKVFPSFVVVGNNLLQREVAKMYQGAIEIIGNPNIKSFDIIHIKDFTNDIHGVVEVEEVQHIFTPDKGFRTIITPNLITFDRDPVQLEDTRIMSELHEEIITGRNRIIGRSFAGAASTTTALTATLGLPGFFGGLAVSVPIIFNGVASGNQRYNKFVYDAMGDLIGRDCINFTTLTYKGEPYMCGFDGLDYTNLTTMINHRNLKKQGFINRLSTFRDPLLAGFAPEWGIKDYLGERWPFRWAFKGIPSNRGNLNLSYIP